MGRVLFVYCSFSCDNYLIRGCLTHNVYMMYLYVLCRGTGFYQHLCISYPVFYVLNPLEKTTLRRKPPFAQTNEAFSIWTWYSQLQTLTVISYSEIWIND